MQMNAAYGPDSSATETPQARITSAVILCFNSARHIRGCVDSIADAYDMAGIPGDIWVVNNGSVDGSGIALAELQARHGDRLTVIESPENLGTTRSRNLALRRSRGENVLVMDADATIPAETLKHLLKRMRDDPSIGIVVPKLLYPDGRYQLSTDEFPTLWRKLERLLFLRSLENASQGPETGTDVDYAISAVWLVRRQVFSDIGELDEQIFYSPEDVDFCVRVWLGGYRIHYDPSVTAFHDAQELSRAKRLSRFTLAHIVGLAYYFRKHRYLFSTRRLRKRISAARRP